MTRITSDPIPEIVVDPSPLLPWHERFHQDRFGWWFANLDGWHGPFATRWGALSALKRMHT